MRKIPIQRLGGGDLRCMTPTQLQEFYAEVNATAQRLFDSVRKKLVQQGPWIYARFWRLASELPIIKNGFEFRDDTIQRYQEFTRELCQALVKRKNPERNKERNAEIMRLHRLGVPPGRIRLMIKKRWPTLENGQPLTVGAIKSVIRQRIRHRQGRRQRTGTL